MPNPRRGPAASRPAETPRPPPPAAETPGKAVGPIVTPSFPIVGIGASAGGLEAFTQLLRALPADTGMAFVLVQHLAPTHASLLAEILSRTTDDAGHRGPGRAAGRAEPRLRHPARPQHDHLGRGPATAAPGAGPRTAPADRSLPPLAGGGPGRQGDRRDPVRHGHRRHPRAGGDQGRGRDHLRPGRHGPADQHAAQRRRQRLRGLRAPPGRRSPGSSRASPGTLTWPRRRRPGARRPRASRRTSARSWRLCARPRASTSPTTRRTASTAASPAAWSCTRWRSCGSTCASCAHHPGKWKRSTRTS